MLFHNVRLPGGRLSRSVTIGTAAVLLAGLLPTTSALAAQQASVPARPTAVAGPNSVPPPDPTPYNPPCNAPRTVSTPIGSRTAYMCSTWTTAPVENWTEGVLGSEHTVGYLSASGYSNWFICQWEAGTDGPGTYNLALTEADNGKWGSVAASYYSGTASTWPLRACTTRETELSDFGH